MYAFFDNQRDDASTFMRRDEDYDLLSIKRAQMLINHDFVDMIFLEWTWEEKRLRIVFNVNKISHQNWIYIEIYFFWVMTWRVNMKRLTREDRIAIDAAKSWKDRDDDDKRDDRDVEDDSSARDHVDNEARERDESLLRRATHS